MGMGSETIEWKIELLTVLCICFSSITVADITLTVSPSNDVEVNQTVTLTFKPEVTLLTPSPYIVLEGQTAKLSCVVLDANPNTSIAWRWFRAESPHNVLYNGSTYTIPSIQRTRSGSYSCTASNSVGTLEAVSILVDVLFKPEVTSLTPSQYRVLEEQTATLSCVVLDANPNTSIAWRWFRAESPYNVLHNGSTYTIPSIQRTRSGSYSCIASNSVGKSEAVSILVDVLYRPHIIDTPSITVNESDRAVLTKEIVSNPLSNVSWYNGSELLLTQSSVRIAIFIIEKAMCTDTKNFTLVASNTVERNVAGLVELIVNCSPRSHDTNITLGVTDILGIEFSTTVFAYPEPRYELRYDNGTINNRMVGSIIRNAVNNYTIHFNQTVVKQDDFGTYHLFVSNMFGETTVFLNVLPQTKPSKPRNAKTVCETTGAKVQWISSFNGGDVQSFTVTAMNGQYKESESYTLADNGQNKIHSTYIQNLRPQTIYMFYVSARNRHGFSSSENISCTTLTEYTGSLSIIYGSAAAGGITFAIIVIVVVVLFRRFNKRDNHERNSDRNNTMRTNDDASHYTTLAERQENNGQMYESLKKTEITDKRNICDKQMIDKNPKDLTNIYVNYSVTANTAEYINLSFAN